MRDLHDAHVSDMMLDLTGERRPVPPVAAATAASRGRTSDASGVYRETTDASGVFRHTSSVHPAATLGNLPACPAKASAEPSGGDFTGPATHVWSGGANGVGGAPDAIRDAYAYRPQPTDADRKFDEFVRASQEAFWALSIQRLHDAIWDTAVAIARAEPPAPIAGAGPWVEGDEAYRVRLGMHRLSDGFLAYIEYAGLSLDDIGAQIGLPRARLARKEW